MKILITEELAEAGIEKLRESYEVDVALGLEPEELHKRISDADALIVRSATTVDEAVFDAAGQLKVVGRAGIGVDNIDLDAATHNGVLVVNAPESNVVSAAEHTIALLLAQARNVAEADATLRDGRWERKKLKGVELYSKTLGILGLGRVGGLVAERAAAFDMNLVGYDPFVSEERARVLGVELLASIDEVFAASDFITIHMPRTPETENLVNAESIEKMRDGVRIINVARGGLVDEAALAAAIESGKVGGAAVDVFPEEPAVDSPLFGQRAATVTPHLGASTAEAQDRAGVTIAEQVAAALAGEFAAHTVNVDMGRELTDVVRDFLPVCEALGRVYAAYAGGIGDRVDIEFAGAIAEHDTKALQLSVLRGLFAKAVEQPVTLVNAPLIAQDHGLEVDVHTSVRARDYVNLVGISGTVAGRVYTIQATVHGDRKDPRIVRIDDFTIEIPPSTHMAIVSNDDRPGVIGAVGSILGNAGVNIANMAVGRHIERSLACWGVSTDEPVPDEVRSEILGTPGIIEARFIKI